MAVVYSGPDFLRRLSPGGDIGQRILQGQTSDVIREGVTGGTGTGGGADQPSQSPPPSSSGGGGGGDYGNAPALTPFPDINKEIAKKAALPKNPAFDSPTNAIGITIVEGGKPITVPLVPPDVSGSTLPKPNTTLPPQKIIEHANPNQTLQRITSDALERDRQRQLEQKRYEEYVRVQMGEIGSQYAGKSPVEQAAQGIPAVIVAGVFNPRQWYYRLTGKNVLADWEIAGWEKSAQLNIKKGDWLKYGKENILGSPAYTEFVYPAALMMVIPPGLRYLKSVVPRAGRAVEYGVGGFFGGSIAKSFVEAPGETAVSLAMLSSLGLRLPRSKRVVSWAKTDIGMSTKPKEVIDFGGSRNTEYGSYYNIGKNIKTIKEPMGSKPFDYTKIEDVSIGRNTKITDADIARWDLQQKNALDAFGLSKPSDVSIASKRVVDVKAEIAASDLINQRAAKSLGINKVVDPSIAGKYDFKISKEDISKFDLINQRAAESLGLKPKDTISISSKTDWKISDTDIARWNTINKNAMRSFGMNPDVDVSIAGKIDMTMSKADIVRWADINRLAGEKIGIRYNPVIESKVLKIEDIMQNISKRNYQDFIGKYEFAVPDRNMMYRGYNKQINRGVEKITVDDILNPSRSSVKFKQLQEQITSPIQTKSQLVKPRLPDSLKKEYGGYNRQADVINEIAIKPKSPITESRYNEVLKVFSIEEYSKIKYNKIDSRLNRFIQNEYASMGVLERVEVPKKSFTMPGKNRFNQLSRIKNIDRYRDVGSDLFAPFVIPSSDRIQIGEMDNRVVSGNIPMSRLEFGEIPVNMFSSDVVSDRDTGSDVRDRFMSMQGSDFMQDSITIQKQQNKQARASMQRQESELISVVKLRRGRPNPPPNIPKIKTPVPPFIEEDEDLRKRLQNQQRLLRSGYFEERVYGSGSVRQSMGFDAVRRQMKMLRNMGM